MEINIKFDEKMIDEAANRVLDEYEYNGKTIREWADLIANPKTNADRIRSMADKELAKWYFDVFFKRTPYCSIHEDCPEHDDCELCLLDWLREEVKE